MKRKLFLFVLLVFGAEFIYSQAMNNLTGTNLSAGPASVEKYQAKDEPPKESGVFFENPYYLFISGAPVFTFDSPSSVGYLASLDFSFINYCSVGIFGFGSNILCNYKNFSGQTGDFVNFFGISFMGRVPIDLGKITLEPQSGIKMGIGNLFSPKYDGVFYLGVTAGVDCIFEITPVFGLKAGLHYMRSYFNFVPRDSVYASIGICLIERI